LPGGLHGRFSACAGAAWPFEPAQPHFDGPDRISSFFRRVFQLSRMPCFLQEDAAFSRPWPMRSRQRLIHVPLFSARPCSTPDRSGRLRARCLAVDDIEFGFAERRSDFVLTLSRVFGSHDLIAFLDGLYARYPRASTPKTSARARPCGPGLPNMTPIFSRICDENQAGAGFRKRCRELEHAFDISRRLQTNLRVAHVAFPSSAWEQRGDGVH